MQKLKIAFFALLLNVGLISPSASAQPSAKEDSWFFKPVRLGLCAGIGPGCYLAGVKAELSGRFIGVQANAGLLWAGIGAKVYPGVAIHRETWSIRPYLQGGTGGGLGLLIPSTGGGVGADVHLLRGKRLLLQPQISVIASSSTPCESELVPPAEEAGGAPPPSSPSYPTCPEGQTEIVQPTSVGASLAVMFAF